MAHILHIENDPGLARMFRDVSQVIGHTAVHASSAAEALGMLRDGLEQEPPKLPDIVVTDRDTGAEEDAATLLVETMHALRIDLPVIVFSSRRDGLPDGVIFLEKPADIDHIEHALAQALEQQH